MLRLVHASTSSARTEFPPLYCPWSFALSLSKGEHLWIGLKENPYYIVESVGSEKSEDWLAV
ncbi:MAG: hypothetical protein HY268_25985 [Deltaproteobacteria bacterium]|nr:hypothetical protein [Deltaproteobacteria bacterium]